MSNTRVIYCNVCTTDVDAVVTTGLKVYPTRKNLHSLVLWECPTCASYVGTHKNSPTFAPLGTIATPELRKIRRQLHGYIDPIWKSGAYTRTKLYALISKHIGHTFHTGGVNSVEEANKVYYYIQTL